MEIHVYDILYIREFDEETIFRRETGAASVSRQVSLKRERRELAPLR